jgi:glycerol-3-phosphate dehydrogenase
VDSGALMVRLVRRDPSTYGDTIYDVVVVGGGIFGICVAWDAALRGLSVILIERADFAEGTSANCFKIVHSGLRYLQHGDLSRIRESAREFSVLLRIAPHLVEPLPVVVPTYGRGMRGKGVLRAALWAYDLATLDRNRWLPDPARRIPRGRALSRDECLRLFPDLDRNGLTGAVMFYDGQMYSPARLALSFLKSAVQAGTDAINHLEATDLLREGDRIFGVAARDALTGRTSTVRGRVVVNACGPWAEQLLGASLGLRLTPRLSYSRDAYFVVAHRELANAALAVPSRTKDPDAILSRGPRHLFIAPWQRHTLIGVWHTVYSGNPDGFTVTETELRSFLDEINDRYSGLALTPEDLAMYHAGLILFGDNSAGAVDLRFGHRSRVADHAAEHRVQGLISVIGVRYTTARRVAERVVDLAFRKLGRTPPPSRTATTPVYGGHIPRFNALLRDAIEHRPPRLTAEGMRALVRNHGSQYRDVLAYLHTDSTLGETVAHSTILKAEVIHAVRAEMAMTLRDVVFRRTDLGSAGHPGAAALIDCGRLVAAEMGWDESRTQRELREVEAVFPSFGKPKPLACVRSLE